MPEDSSTGRLLNYHELLLTLHGLCKEKRSGVMVINSEIGAAKLTLDQGAIIDVTFRGLNGTAALLQIKAIQHAKAIFVTQIKVTVLSPLNLSNAEVFQILQESAPTSTESAPVLETSTRAQTPLASEEHMTVIEAHLALIIGPVARVVYREYREEIQRTETIEALNVLIEKIAKQVLGAEQQKLFKQVLRQYIEQQGLKSAKSILDAFKSTGAELKPSLGTLSLFVAKYAAQGDLGQGLLTKLVTELEAISNLAGSVELLDVLRLFEKTTKTGFVEVHAKEKKGFFYFDNGVLINATEADKQGARTAIELLQWQIDYLALFSRPLTGVSREIQQTVDDLAKGVSHLRSSIISKEEAQKYLKTDKATLSSDEIQDALAKEIERLKGRIDSKKEDSKSSELDSFSNVVKAVQLAESGNAYAAEQIFSQELKTHDDNFDAWLWLSRVSNNMTAIEFALKKAANINSKSSDLAEDIKKFTAARKTIKTDFVLRCPFCWMQLAVKGGECPNCSSELYLAGDFFDHAGKAKTEILDKVIERYSNALQKDPANASNSYLHFYLAMAYLNRKYYQEGLEQFEEISPLAPENRALAQQAQILTAYMKSQGVFVKQTAPETQAAPQQSSKVLVVEDSLVTRKVIARTLAANGYQVFEAKDAEEALFDIEARNPELVLLDIILPGKDGYEILAEIRQKPLLAKVPVIMLTSRDSLFDKLKGKVSDANEYLTKPFQPDDLIKIVKKYLK